MGKDQLAVSTDSPAPAGVRGGEAFRGTVSWIGLAALASALLGHATEPDSGVFRPAADQAVRAKVAEAATADAGAGDEPWVVRQRLVSVDLDRLEQLRAASAPLPSVRSKSGPPAEAPALPEGGVRSEAALRLNLFDGSTVTAVVEHAEETYSGGYALFGRVLGDEFGRVTLVVNGGVVAGTVSLSGGTYRIRTAGGGLHSVVEIDESALPPPGEPLLTLDAFDQP